MTDDIVRQTLPRHIITTIALIGKSRLPNEACGLLLPTPLGTQGRVIELPNRALEPGVFHFTGSDVLLALAHWEGDWENICVWHTHPSGRTEPSEGDLANKVPELPFGYFIVTSDKVPSVTWY